MKLFTSRNLSLSNGTWAIKTAIIDFNSDIYKKATSQSRLKSQHTMNASQAGGYRSPELKYQRQLMGIIAEIYSQEYLKEVLEENELNKTWEVLRYDDIRTDGFKSPANEFDLKIKGINNSREFIIESRSSIARDRSLTTAIEQFDIIGPYTSIAKSGEEMSDFYTRPLYEFIPYQNSKFLPTQFETHLKNGNIKLHIVACCTKSEMINNGYDKSMNQGRTLYRVIKITKGQDMVSFGNSLIQSL